MSSSEISRLEDEIERLQISSLLQRDEVRSLKAEARSYRDEIASLNQSRADNASNTQQEKISSREDNVLSQNAKINALASRIEELESRAQKDAPALAIGREVRLRYMEKYRLDIMGRSIGKAGYERIKAGHRAAHCGRPVVDAILCLEGLITDHKAYKDLYGVSVKDLNAWKDVPEIVEVAGFRGSLQSEGRVTDDFHQLFEDFMAEARSYASTTELKAAFETNKTLVKYHNGLQDCYDKIVAMGENRRSPMPTL